MWRAASFAVAYGLSGRHTVSSCWGLSGAAPKIAPDPATNTRVSGLSSRTASSSVAVDPAIAASVRAGRSQDSGTNEGAAR